jgi:hypothetical protein
VRLATLTEFRRIVFTDDSAPAVATLRANIGKIPGGTKMGGRYFVDLDRFDAETKLHQGLADRRRTLERDEDLAELM